jgi:hypothetical protein
MVTPRYIPNFYGTAAVVCGLAISSQVAAVPITYTDKTTFLTAAGSTTTYGFETHGVTEGVDLPSPLSASQLDNNFDLAYTNLNAFSIVDDAAGPGVVDGTHYLFTHSVGLASEYSLTFSNFGASNNSVTAFGFTITDFASNIDPNDTVTITYNIGDLTGTLLTVTGPQPDYTQNFVGLTVDSGEAFNLITLTMNDTLSGFQDFDEIIYTPIPAALWLFGSGLLGLIGISRRKKTS